jgi:hypothetical protein
LNTIHALYGRDTEVPGGGEVDPEVDTIYIFIGIALNAFLQIKEELPVRKCRDIFQIVKNCVSGSEELCVR